MGGSVSEVGWTSQGRMVTDRTFLEGGWLLTKPLLLAV